jgi:hypothetical protein
MNYNTISALSCGESTNLHSASSLDWGNSRRTGEACSSSHQLDFVLDHYVARVIQELGGSQLSQLLTLRYGSVSDRVVDLGAHTQVREIPTFKSSCINHKPEGRRNSLPDVLVTRCYLASKPRAVQLGSPASQARWRFVGFLHRTICESRRS